MTLDELPVKFDALAEPVMSEPRRAALRDIIFGLEDVEDAGALMALAVADA